MLTHKHFQRPMILAAQLLLCVWIAPACREDSTLRSPQGSLRLFAEAVKEQNAVAIYRLLDRKSQWSIMSIYKNQRKIHFLVKRSYPAARQARALRLAENAIAASSAAAHFATLAHNHKLLTDLPRPGAKQTAQTVKKGKALDGAWVELRSQGRTHRFCQEERLWRYCGLRHRLEKLKLRVSRNLTTIKENVEMFKAGR